MGFFDSDNALLGAIAGPTAGIARGLLYDNPAGKPGYTDPRNTYIKNNSSNQGIADLISKIYNTEGARNYGNTFDQAYEGLGQPLHDNNRDEIYTEGTRALASSFADSVYKRTGSLPTEDQIRKFVGTNLTPGFAQKFITGMAPDQINGLTEQYISGNPDALTNPGTQSAEEQRLGGLKAQLDKIYDTGKQNYVSNYDETVYGPGKQRLANDLAGQGMLTQPNSRISLDALEGNRGRDLASGLNTLEGNRAAGQVDLGKSIEDLLQKDKDRSQNAYQFNQNFNANRDDTFFNQGLQRKQQGLAEQLGRLQAGSQKKDWMDYLNTGLNVVGTAAKAKTAFA